MSELLFSLLSPDDPTQIFSLVEEIAAGAFGVVLKGVYKPTGEDVAVKICAMEDEESLGDLAMEITVLKKTNHPNLVKFFGAYRKESEIYIAMELCATSVNTLFEVLDHGLKEAEIGFIVRETLKGLVYLHELGIIHRDVKAPNILITSKGDIKLADFGVSAILGTKDEKRTTFVGTPWWMAPEIILGCRDVNYAYDYSVDIWALGITCIELAEMKPPRGEFQPMEVIYEIVNNDPPSLSSPEKWSSDFKNFISTCLEKDQTARITAASLLNHPFLNTRKGGGGGGIGNASTLAQILSAVDEITSQFQSETIQETIEYEDDDDDDDDDPSIKTLKKEDKQLQMSTFSSRTTTVKATYKPKTLREQQSLESRILAERSMAQQVKVMKKHQKNQLKVIEEMKRKHYAELEKHEKKVDKEIKKLSKEGEEIKRKLGKDQKEEMENFLKANNQMIKEKRKINQERIKDSQKKLQAEQKLQATEYKETTKNQIKAEKEKIKAGPKDKQDKLKSDLKERAKVTQAIFEIEQLLAQEFQDSTMEVENTLELVEVERKNMVEKYNKAREHVKSKISLLAQILDTKHKTAENGLAVREELEAKLLEQFEAAVKNQLEKQQNEEKEQQAKSQPAIQKQLKKDHEITQKKRETEMKMNEKCLLLDKKAQLNKKDYEKFEKKIKEKRKIDLKLIDMEILHALMRNRVQKEGIFMVRQMEDMLKQDEALLLKKQEGQEILFQKRYELRVACVTEMESFYNERFQELYDFLTQFAEEETKWLEEKDAQIKTDLERFGHALFGVQTQVGTILANVATQARDEVMLQVSQKIDLTKSKIRKQLDGMLHQMKSAVYKHQEQREAHFQEEKKKALETIAKEKRSTSQGDKKKLITTQTGQRLAFVTKLEGEISSLLKVRCDHQLVVLQQHQQAEQSFLEKQKAKSYFFKDDVDAKYEYTKKMEAQHEQQRKEINSRYQSDISQLRTRCDRKREGIMKEEDVRLKDLLQTLKGAVIATPAFPDRPKVAPIGTTGSSSSESVSLVSSASLANLAPKQPHRKTAPVPNVSPVRRAASIAIEPEEPEETSPSNPPPRKSSSPSRASSSHTPTAEPPTTSHHPEAAPMTRSISMYAPQGTKISGEKQVTAGGYSLKPKAAGGGYTNNYSFNSKKMAPPTLEVAGGGKQLSRTPSYIDQFLEEAQAEGAPGRLAGKPGATAKPIRNK